MSDLSENVLGRVLAWVAVSTAVLSLLATSWPLLMAIRAFREPKYRSQNPSRTHYLNLMCLSLTFLLGVQYVVLEAWAFVCNANYQKIRGFEPNILLGIVSLVKTAATYSYALVVLDRYKIFGNIIRYPRILLPILHGFGFICFLISFITHSWIFSDRIQKYDDYLLPSWNSLKYAIQFFSVTLDISVITQIMWAFLKKLKESNNSPFRDYSSEIHDPLIPEKWQLIGLLALMILLDIGAFVLGFGTFYNRKDIASVCQFIGENAFGFHIVIGLVVLLKLKATVVNKAVDLASHVPDIQLSTRKINVIALPEDGYEIISPAKFAYSPRNSF